MSDNRHQVRKIEPRRPQYLDDQLWLAQLVLWMVGAYAAGTLLWLMRDLSMPPSVPWLVPIATLGATAIVSTLLPALTRRGGSRRCWLALGLSVLANLSLVLALSHVDLHPPDQQAMADRVPPPDPPDVQRIEEFYSLSAEGDDRPMLELRRPVATGQPNLEPQTVIRRTTVDLDEAVEQRADAAPETPQHPVPSVLERQEFVTAVPRQSADEGSLSRQELSVRPVLGPAEAEVVPETTTAPLPELLAAPTQVAPQPSSPAQSAPLVDREPLATQPPNSAAMARATSDDERPGIAEAATSAARAELTITPTHASNVESPSASQSAAEIVEPSAAQLAARREAPSLATPRRTAAVPDSVATPEIQSTPVLVLPRDVLSSRSSSAQDDTEVASSSSATPLARSDTTLASDALATPEHAVELPSSEPSSAAELSAVEPGEAMAPAAVSEIGRAPPGTPSPAADTAAAAASAELAAASAATQPTVADGLTRATSPTAAAQMASELAAESPATGRPAASRPEVARAAVARVEVPESEPGGTPRDEVTDAPTLAGAALRQTTPQLGADDAEADDLLADTAAAPPAQSTPAVARASMNDDMSPAPNLVNSPAPSPPRAASARRTSPSPVAVELPDSDVTAAHVAAANETESLAANTAASTPFLTRRTNLAPVPSGGLAVPVDVPDGIGGLATDLARNVGTEARQARPESDQIVDTLGRFMRRPAGRTLSIRTEVVIPATAYQTRLNRLGEELAGGQGRPSPKTEDAIELGLIYLSSRQRPDGSWSLGSAGDQHDLDSRGPNASPLAFRSDTAATGLSLLSFLGAGYHHRGEKYHEVVRSGLQFLIEHQRPDGDLYVPQDRASNVSARLYSHAIASIALCEAYGMTQDSELLEPAQRAVNFIVASQHPTRGAWRYSPGVGSDTSVSGWMVMALRSAELANLQVSPEAWRRVETWLDRAQASSDRPELYRYNPFAPNNLEQGHGRRPTKTMTAVGLLMRMYTGWHRDHPPMIAGAEYLQQNPPQLGNARDPQRDTYYWYYATQVMFHMRGEYWEAWNEQLHPLLTSSQVQTGPLAGSWDPDLPEPDRWAPQAGRLYVTTLNLLSLEVYYRHLPIYEDTAR